MSPWVYTFIAVTVTVVWALMNIASIFSGNAVPSYVHGIMGLVAGSFFGGQQIAKRREQRRDDTG